MSGVLESLSSIENYSVEIKLVKIQNYLQMKHQNLVHDKDVGVLAESLHLVIDQWIQYKLGKQYL